MQKEKSSKKWLIISIILFITLLTIAILNILRNDTIG